MKKLVRNCTEYLNLADIWNQSSKKLTTPKGKKYSQIFESVKNKKIRVIKKKESPPPEGLGIKWELLWLGLSKRFFFKNGNKDRINT